MTFASIQHELAARVITNHSLLRSNSRLHHLSTYARGGNGTYPKNIAPLYHMLCDSALIQLTRHSNTQTAYMVFSQGLVHHLYPVVINHEDLSHHVLAKVSIFLVGSEETKVPHHTFSEVSNFVRTCAYFSGFFSLTASSSCCQ